MSDQQWQPFGPRPPGPRTPTGPSYPDGSAHPSGAAHHHYPSGPSYPSGPTGPEPPYGGEPEGSEHDAAAAYVLGILDDAQASAFEAHLAGCARCSAHLDEFAGMEPVLAMLAEAPAAVPGARPVPHVPERPAPKVLGGLMDEVAHRRHRRTRRSRYLIAAAAALIIGGPVAAVAVTAGDGDGGRNVAVGDPHPTSPAEDAFFQHMTEKVSGTFGRPGRAGGRRPPAHPQQRAERTAPVNLRARAPASCCSTPCGASPRGAAATPTRSWWRSCARPSTRTSPPRRRSWSS
ncbi:hypothetical protein SMICM17S_10228 [Streptomyces microflavus]